ncbi:DUF4333 domain-containing protein [Saccharothrix hoggarensis]|uniref:DUF4333 domain-containing protein n=1 Tax=Saccharothrix hoggarensis TaxID=913853 RepID=A0ABW3R1P1_9PSEU
MTSPYGPSGGNDPQPQWGQQQQPYGGGYPGTPSGGFPAQQPNPYGQPDPSQQQWGQQPQQPYTQQYPAGYDPNNPQSNPYGQPQQGQYGQPGQFGQPDQFGQQGQYGQPGQFGQPGQYGQQPPKKSSAVLWVVVGIVVLAVAAVGILGFVAPGWFTKKEFDQAAVQTGVVGILKDVYKIQDVEGATCPAGQEVKPNTTFECTVKVGGKDKTVKVTVKTEDGEYEVGQPAG